MVLDKMTYDIVLHIAIIFVIFAEKSCIIGSNQEDSSRQSKRGNILNHATCGSKVPGTNVLLCHCDELCVYYKDCCYSYAQNESRSSQIIGMVEKVHKTECTNFSGDEYSYLMHSVSFDLSRVTASASRFIVYCQEADNTNPFMAVPVYSYKSRVHFKNNFCYILSLRISNLRFETESFEMWTAMIASDCFQKSFNEFRVKQLFGTYMEFLAIVFSRKHCNIALVPPENSTSRICFQQDTGSCKNKDDCQSYQSPVIGETSRLFKNVHCVACSGSRVISSVSGREPVADRKTLLTLHHLSMGLEPYILPLVLGINPYDTCKIEEIITEPINLGCNLTCPDDQMRYFNTCIQPIAKVRGFLHQLEVKASSGKTLSLDQNNKAKIARAVLNMIGPLADFYVISKLITAKTISSGCLHIVDIAIYLGNDVTYIEYLNISQYVTEIFVNQKEELEIEIVNMTLKGEPCLEIGTIYNDGGSTNRQASMTDRIRVVIFSSIFGVFIAMVVAVTVIKAVMNKLAQNRETETNE